MKTKKCSAENCTREEMERAKWLINDFCEREYGDLADFENPARIGIGYTTVTEEELPFEIYVNLMDFCIERYLDGRLIEIRRYGSLRELIGYELEYLDFSGLADVSVEALV